MSLFRGKPSSQSMSASRQATSWRPQAVEERALFAAVPVRLAADPGHHGLHMRLRERCRDVDPVQRVQANVRCRWGQPDDPMTHTLAGFVKHRSEFAGRIEHTTEPVQKSSVVTAVVVLNPPEPANISEWVEPVATRSISNGARPPFPSSAVAGIERMLETLS